MDEQMGILGMASGATAELAAMHDFIFHFTTGSGPTVTLVATGE
jgi:hypothetical protein